MVSIPESGRLDSNMCAYRPWGQYDQFDDHRSLAALAHRRNDELRAFLDAGWPARGHRFGLGVEADRVRSVLIEIAEPGPFPAAERVVGEGHGNREVHAD